ncbi:MAG: ribonuclease R [Lachnospiraceae bacterium]|jgi:ribonuclease R|nr:ribonuclease R [Lachnospiraceae bacterium]
MSDYDNNKKKILQLINDKHYKPLKQKELAFLLQVPKENRDDFRQMLKELVDEGKVLLSKRGKYESLAGHTFSGTYTGNQKGFGFVAVEGEKDDYYISARLSKGAMNGDKVIIKPLVSSYGKRKEAEIINITERANAYVVGYFQKRKNFGFVVADDRKLGDDIYIPKRKSMDAVTGHKVVAKITSYGDKKHKPEGEIIEVLGHVNDPGVDILSIIKAYGLDIEFPKEVMSEVSLISDDVDINECGDRLDLRDVKMVTIDGADAKDLDDAISLQKTKTGYTLGVHIADVSNYVKEYSCLDREALKRGTSVYLADRVIPMLPHKLSNGICSLNAGCDRLALSCIMDIDKDGNVTGHKIAETLINVDKRMTYDKVYELLIKSGAIKSEDINPDTIENESEYDDYIEMFEDMLSLSKLIREKRMKRGSIDFDFPEASITLSEDGVPIEIGVRQRNPAHMIIEDFMLLANETVAEDYYWQELPFEFRVHEEPDKEKYEKLVKIISGFGYNIKLNGEKIYPKEIQKLLNKIEGTEEEDFISRITLRSMHRAKYSTECTGHFGLAAKYYCHFTSPIRRYPDLQIHRIIKENLHGELTDKRIVHYNNLLPEVAFDNSRRERIAQETEREVEKLKKVQYMTKHLGEVFEGIISGVTDYGFFVELPNTVEGLVRMATIPDDFYLYDEHSMTIVGKQTGTTYRIGQKVMVEAVRVDKQLRTIDFELYTE